jgi:hypothetical protein
MKYEVVGQDDVTVPITDLADKTLAVVVDTTHVRLKNMAANQVVLYTEVNPPFPLPVPPYAPTFPGDWKRLNPEQEIMLRVPVAAGPVTYVYLRKKSWFRPPLTHRKRADMLDTPVTVRVEGIDLS